MFEVQRMFMNERSRSMFHGAFGLEAQKFFIPTVTMLYMGRLWEHDRWRGLLMQAVMAVILGGTLGLAQLVTYTRNHAPIALGPPRQLGILMVRLPADWVSLPGEAPEPELLQAQDEDGTRELVVSIQSPSSAITPQALRSSAGDSIEPTPIFLRGLGIEGIQLVVPHPEPTPDGKIEEIKYLFVSAQLPIGDWVQIRFRESSSRIGSADRLLVQAVADGITLTDRKIRGNSPRSAPTDPGNFD